MCNCTNETHLGEISIPWEVKAGKIHVRKSRVHVHVHICSGVGSAAIRVVLPGGGKEEVQMDWLFVQPLFIQVEPVHIMLFTLTLCV